jgi:enamine deaminase RidA (YjgF/YER057c/UK114 family)
LAQARAALGTLDRVKQVVRLGGFVTSTPDFTEQPEVVNGCSDLMVEVFGPKGRHARAAVSVPALPRGVAVEVDAIFEIV